MNAPICKSCLQFKRWGDKCWYYWDYKKACTQHCGTEFDEPKFLEIKE